MYTKREMDVMPIIHLLSTKEQVKVLLDALNDSSVDLCFVSRYIMTTFIHVVRTKHYASLSAQQKQNFTHIEMYVQNNALYTT